MNVPKKYTVLCLLAISCLLSACSSLTRSDKPAVTTWWLKPYDGSTAAAVADPVLPVAVSVTAVPGLDSNQILALSAAAELKPYASARWAEYLPELTASLIGRSLEASGRFEFSTGRPGARPQSCELQLELTEFFAELDPGGLTTGVSVAVKGHFQCESDAAVVIRAGASIPVADDRMNVIVAAFQRAMDRVTKEILDKI